MFQAIARLQVKVVQVVTDLKKGDSNFTRDNILNEWAKESCQKIGALVTDDKLIWIAKDFEQPKIDPRTLMN
jgi:hypothetical protein